MSKNRSQSVERIFMDCLFRDDELVDGKPQVPPILPTTNIANPVGFNPKRIEEHRAEIAALLDGFPEEFYSDGGGGWTFLNFCNLADGSQWTGMHMRMEQLCQLGNAIGLVEFQMPRDMWGILPGGMPYMVIRRGSADAAIAS